MMKILYLINSAIEQISKNKFLHTILLFTVMVSTAIINYSCAVIHMAIYDTTLIESTKNKNLFCVSASMYRNENSSSMLKPEVYDAYIKLKAQPNIEVGFISNNDYIIDNQLFDVFLYQELLSKNISFKLKEGQQLYEYDGIYVPIILTDNHPLLSTYSCGDIIEITANYSESAETFMEKAKKATIKAEICGIMAKPYRYIESSTTYSSVASDILNHDLEPVIISADWEISSGVLISDKWNIIMPEMDWFADIVAERGTEEYNTAYKYLMLNFNVETYKNFLKLSRANFKQGIADAAYILICVVGLIAVAIGSANIYIGKKQIRSFAINFISGAKWADCVFIELFRNLLVIILPTVISAIISGLYISSQVPEYYDSGMAVDPLSVIFIVLLMTVLFFISSLPYIIKLKKTEPITFVRTMNRE